MADFVPIFEKSSQKAALYPHFRPFRSRSSNFAADFEKKKKDEESKDNGSTFSDAN